ncbi:MAG: rRNA (cytosine-C5-)-methyltransferase nop2 [Thelocarpon superellum]|nr:MAG: rRNA (cytosine-C5-)-methyltransferase nop2 [Thelocarpon superellum]
MGVGRRMKKQGPPPDLGKAHLGPKRKFVEPDGDRGGKKRRTSAAGPKAGARTKNNRSGNGITSKSESLEQKPSKPFHANGNAVPVQNTRPVGTKRRAPRPLIEPDESELELIDDEVEEGEEGEEGDGADENGFLDSDSSVVDSDEERRAIFSEDEDESDAEEKLSAANIAGLSRKLDEQLQEEQDQAQAELEEAALQTNIAGDGDERTSDVDDDDDETRPATRLAPDLQMLRTRLTDTVRILDDFSQRAEAGRSRASYTAQLQRDVCAYYGYSAFLAEKLLNLFPPREAFAFFEANETARPVVIRTNTLKTHRRDLAQSLINRGVTLEPVGKWSKVGLQVFESQVPLGATPEYLAGHYILQAASSFLPVMALAPQEHERILDMAAAPGGKTTYMAALMKNTGVIFANDASKTRAKGLIGNIHRLGAKNTIVSNHDARLFPSIIGGFDRVLLDAPCSGTGVISKDSSVKTNKNARDFLLLPHRQRQLLLSAIDSVDHASRSGGYVVYSTCSVSVEENESVVSYALRKRPNVRLVETGLPFGREGFTNYMGKRFDARMKYTRRFYPHVHNVDGFFVAKLRKVAPTPAPTSAAAATGAGTEEVGVAEVGGKKRGNASTHDREGEGDGDGSGDGGPGWNDAEDKVYIARARRAALRKKGVDPRAVRLTSSASEIRSAGGK